MRRPCMLKRARRVGKACEMNHTINVKKRGRDVDSSEFGAASSSSHVDVALDTCTAMGSFQFPFQMPWESTDFLRQIFSDDATPWLNSVKIPRTLPETELLPQQSFEHKHLQKRSIRASCHAAAATTDPERHKILLQWADLIMLCPEESKSGLQMLAANSADASAVTPLQIVSDCLRSRATSTLKLRASSLALYVGWLTAHHPDEPFLPFSEPRTYEYVSDLRRKACSASRGTTFVSTLSFVKGLLGMNGADECATSVRVAGATLEMFLEKRPLKQAPAMHPCMIAVLELASFCCTSAYTRALAGFALFCLYGRLRISDLNRLSHLEQIGNYIEASLMRVKTARTKEKQTTFLPSIVPVYGVLGLNWFEAFAMNRNALGLDDFPVPTGKRQDEAFVTLPTEATVHLTLGSRASSSDITDGLQEILGMVFNSSAISDITSHSLKTTLLTYVNIFGTDPTDSELLGYHLTAHKSALNYQRAALAAPMRHLCNVLCEVQQGRFLPMAGRDEVFQTIKPLTVHEQLPSVVGMTAVEIVELFLGCSLDAAQYDESLDACLRSLIGKLCVEPKVFPSSATVLQAADMGSWSPIPSPTEVAGDTSAAMDVISDSDDSSKAISHLSDDDSDSASSSAERGMATAVQHFSPAEGHEISKNAHIGMYYRHRRTRTLHMAHVDSDAKTACGRLLGSTYARFYGDIDSAWPHCHHCFGS